MGQPTHEQDNSAVENVRKEGREAMNKANVGNEGEANNQQQPQQKSKQDAEAEKKYEEAMEDEYAKREGGA